MRRTVCLKPRVRRRLVRTEFLAYAVGQNLRTAARNRLQPRRTQPQEHLAHRAPRTLCKMRDFHARKALQIERGKRLMQSLEPHKIVLERPVRMQPAHHMQPREMRIAHRIRDVRHRLRRAHLVGARILCVTPKRAELTVRHADIRQIHMAVHIVVDNIAAFLRAHMIGEGTEPRDVVRGKEPQPILPCQPLAILYFLLNIQVFAVQSFFS